MGEANRKIDLAVREALKRMNQDATIGGLVQIVSGDLSRPVHASTIRNSLRRQGIDLTPGDE
jgi:hypothetical protein